MLYGNLMTIKDIMYKIIFQQILNFSTNQLLSFNTQEMEETTRGYTHEILKVGCGDGFYGCFGLHKGSPLWPWLNCHFMASSSSSFYHLHFISDSLQRWRPLFRPNTFAHTKVLMPQDLTWILLCRFFFLFHICSFRKASSIFFLYLFILNLFIWITGLESRHNQS